MKAGRAMLLDVLLIGSSLSWAKGLKSAEIPAIWDISVAADGSIEKLSVVSPLPPALVPKLEEEIRRWTFRPGRINGAPVASSTSLTVRLGLEQQSDESVYVKLLSGTTGSRASKIAAPEYPEFAVRQKRGGLVVLVGKYNADGKVTEVELHDESPVKKGALIGAAKSGVQYFQMQPEIVGGRAVAGSFIVPVCFNFRTSPGQRADCEWKRSEDKVSLKEGQALALNPEVTLETDIQGKIL